VDDLGGASFEAFLEHIRPAPAPPVASGQVDRAIARIAKALYVMMAAMRAPSSIRCPARISLYRHRAESDSTMDGAGHIVRSHIVYTT
jgi:hypothetical protein